MNQFLGRAKTFLVISLAIALGSLIVSLAYLNQIGFPGQYGEWLRARLAERGIHLSFESIHYDLRKGLVATSVSFYGHQSDSSPILTADEVIIDIDKVEALQGIIKLRKIDLLAGNVSIPVAEESPAVRILGLTGSVTISESNRVEIDRATGFFEGIHLTFSSELKLPQQSQSERSSSELQFIDAKALTLVFDELKRWNYAATSPPRLSLSTRGDLSTPERIKTKFSLTADDLSREKHKIRRLKLSGDVRSHLITLDEIYFEDFSGTASAKADWNLKKKEGRFDLTSSLQFQPLLKTSIGVDFLSDLHCNTAPNIKTFGTYSLNPQNELLIHAIGRATLERFHYRDTPYDHLSSEFSFQDGNLYLRDFELTHREGHLNGELLLKENLLTYDFHSTLPFSAFEPLLSHNHELREVISDFQITEKTNLHFSSSGSMDLNAPSTGITSGKFRFENLAYKGTALHHLTSDYHFNPEEIRFSNTSTLLDDRMESVRLRGNSQASEELVAKGIVYHFEKKLTTIDGLFGKVWPTPIIRLFDPKTADYLRQNFRFDQPPSIKLDGTIAGKSEDKIATQLKIELSTQGTTEYPFLGKELPMKNLEANISVSAKTVDVSDLTFSTLGGTGSGSVSVTIGEGNPYQGTIKWDKLSFPLISKVYQFDKEEAGDLTGNIDFRGSGSSVRLFNADGLIGIRQGNLVSVPILGPLSPLIAKVLGDQRLGFERAKDASATFAIRNGVIQTKDFVATSDRLHLTGEGSIDLASKKIEMIARLNARGLLGFITLPLQPLKGIFQFRGSGTYSEPNWRSSPFTRPTRGDQDPIFQKPGRAQIIGQ